MPHTSEAIALRAPGSIKGTFYGAFKHRQGVLIAQLAYTAYREVI